MNKMAFHLEIVQMFIADTNDMFYVVEYLTI